MDAIKFEHLNFTYPGCDAKALNDINITIEDSEFVVLCGKSGCGKSTFLKHIKKNLIPYGQVSGKVLYFGTEIEDLDDRLSTAEIGYVQQNPDNQLVTDKVWHELAFGLESLGYDNSAIKRKVAEMASFFGIQTWFRKNVSELSGGQKQILNLASIMAMQPKVLILDEPTSQLDPIAASEFLKTIYKINREIGTTIIISEHRLEELFPMADKVIVMDQGSITGYDSPFNIGKLLSDGAEKHPMFYGLPTVMKIYAHVRPQGPCPLTIRAGRMWLEELVGSPGDEKVVKRKPSRLELKNIGTTHEKKDTRETAISIKNLWFKYSKESGDVLKGVSLDVKKGEIFAVLGGNGVGKSTTLKAICGIVKPQSGSIFIGGQNTAKLTNQEMFTENLAMLPQNPQALFTEITVEEELLEALHYIKNSDHEKAQKVEEIMQTLEIDFLRKSHPYDLSGGEQQRLALGKILLLNPKILILDEPTKGLDPFFKRTLGDLFQELKQRGVTIFLVSHDIEFCAEYADRCAMFFDGEIVSLGTPKEFFPGNNFYTTSANRLARGWYPGVVTWEEVCQWVEENMI